VRELSRVISSIARKIALGIVNGEIEPSKRVGLTIDDVIRLLGKEKYSKDDLDKKAAVGVVNGLSYTSAGGDILKLEVVLTPSANEKGGELKLTGNLGNVMKESAQLALSITKSLAKDYGIDNDAFKNNDIHIHVPSGAVPKDGPSAGVALVVALISAFSGKPVRGDFALTGEITLSGKVLEIGGVREKILSAYRYGIENVIMPTQNQKSLEKVPEEVKEKLNFVFANNINDVLGSMLVSH
jgi:ATP-dependent Lon protease